MRAAPLMIALLCASAASAQPVSLIAGGDPLELTADPAFPHGKVALLEGTATPQAQRWSLANLEILQPVSVTVLTQAPNDDVAIALSKYTWDKQPARQASTKGTTSSTLQLRTAGDLLIDVRAATPTPFQLVVWVGDPVPANLPPIVVEKSAITPVAATKPVARKRRTDPTLLVSIGAAIVVAAIALLARRRRTT